MAARLGHAIAHKTKLWKGKRSLAKAVSDPKKAPLPVDVVVEKRPRRSRSSSSDIYARYGLPVPKNVLNAGSGSMSIDVSSGDEDVDLEVVDFVDVSASKNKSPSEKKKSSPAEASKPSTSPRATSGTTRHE